MIAIASELTKEIEVKNKEVEEKARDCGGCCVLWATGRRISAREMGHTVIFTKLFPHLHYLESHHHHQLFCKESVHFLLLPFCG